MPVPEDEITLRFPLLDFETKRIERYQLDSDYTTLTDGWSVDVYDPDPERFRNVELQPVEILINGTSQLLGRVEVVRRGDRNGTSVSLQGRDYLADMVECHVDPSLKIEKDQTLGDALLLAAGPVGITEVLDDAKVSMRNIRTGATQGGPSPATFTEIKVESLKPGVGQGLGAWCENLTKRHGGTLQPGKTRSQLVLAAPHYGQPSRYRVLRRRLNPEANSNNIVTAEAVSDVSSFPTHVLVAGRQGRKGSQKAAQGLDQDVDWPGADTVGNLIQAGRLRPADGPKQDTDALYRLRYVRDDEARNAAQLERLMLRALAELLKESLVYTVTFRGHADPESGALYGVDTIIDVDDDVCDVHEPLWVASRTFLYDQGPKTQLTCWRLGTFVI